MNEIKIEKGIGLPHPTGDAARKYPFNTMEVGDSFLINGFDPKACGNAAWQHGRRYSQKFTVRKTPDGYRCWRVS